MTAQQDGGPVYPTNESNYQQNYSDTGISLRDHFAGIVLPSTITEYWRGASAGEFQSDENWRYHVALDCYKQADAMLRARGESPKQEAPE